MTATPILAALAAAAIATSGVASAATGMETRQALVTYHDLDLATPAGQKALRQRVDGAVSRVCGIADLATHLEVTSCRTEARREATLQLRQRGLLRA